MAGNISILGGPAAFAVQAGEALSVGLPDHMGPDVALPEASGSAATMVQRVAPVPAASDISFSIDDASGQIIFQVHDPSTGAMIRQVPSEEQVALEARIRQLLGTLLDRAV
ncbi:MAG: flagellar protein FlaG [Nitrospirota bacterium]|nr:flagellar protein FlaG [Nitrospirota bacterium]